MSPAEVLNMKAAATIALMRAATTADAQFCILCGAFATIEADEREACAALCETLGESVCGCAAAIRAREEVAS